MSEGIGTTRHGNHSFQLNNRKHPFQVMDENKFINPPAIQHQISLELYTELLEVKNQRYQKEAKLTSAIFTGLVIGIISIVGYLGMI